MSAGKNIESISDLDQNDTGVLVQFIKDAFYLSMRTEQNLMKINIL